MPFFKLWSMTRFNDPASGRVRVICVGFTLCLMLGCTGSRTSRSEANSTPTPFAQGYTAPPPTPTPKMWPSFSAEDYLRFKERPLSPGQMKLIRSTLALLKPCQRPLLRFAFPKEGYGDFILFLYLRAAKFHVLWTNNLYFDPDDGTTIAAPGGVEKGSGISFDVANTPCE